MPDKRSCASWCRPLGRRALLQTLPWLVAASAHARPKRPREVLAFYYAWYGDPTNNPDWRGVDRARHVIANTADYPAAGPYDSRDPAIVQTQMRQMRQAGITGIIYSWWGIGSYEDHHFQSVIDAAGRAGLKVSVYYEKAASINHAADPGAVERDLDYLINTYAGARHWLTVADDRYVFIYGDALKRLPLQAWRGILTNVRARHGGRVRFNVAAESAANLDFVDGIHRYALVASLKTRPPGQAASWVRGFYARFMDDQRQYPVATLTVYPGYDDTHLQRRTTFATGRYDGALYAALWEAAIAAGPDWILITSWNEWHEGTEIEPSLQYGAQYLELTARYARAFLR